MKKTEKTLFAIYKNGNHIGNERAKSKDEALKRYLISSNYSELLNDKEFLSNYSLSNATKGIHYY